MLSMFRVEAFLFWPPSVDRANALPGTTEGGLLMIPKGLCQCGCGGVAPLAKQKISRLGLLRGEPRRFIHGHNRIKSAEEYRLDDFGCWIWLRGKDSDGYGGANLNGQRMSAHVKYYTIHKGRIPKGFEIDHLCRNHSCVNPEHLEAVTKVENVRRGLAARGYARKS